MSITNIFVTFVEKSTTMAKYELTDKQIVALQRLNLKESEFRKIHIPVKTSNVYFCNPGRTFERLSKTIAVDVYTSTIGRGRLRECYDCIRQLNRRGKLGNTDTFLRLLNERVQYYLGILCGTINPTPIINTTLSVAQKKTKTKTIKQQANAVKTQQRAKVMFESRLHAYIPDSQFQSQYRSTIASHNLIKDDDYEHGLSDID